MQELVGKYVIVPTWAGSLLQVVTGYNRGTGRFIIENLRSPSSRNSISPDDISKVLPRPPAYQLGQEITTLETIDNKNTLVDGEVTEILYRHESEEYYYVISNTGLFLTYALESQSVPSCQANRPRKTQ